MDSAIVDFGRVDYKRCDVYKDFFEILKSQFEKKYGLSVDVAKFTLIHWASKIYEESSIEMLMVPQTAVFDPLSTALNVRLTTTGYTLDPVSAGDEIRDSNNENWEVTAVKPVWLADNFVYRECSVTKFAFNLLLKETVILRNLSLGAQDSVTGWYAENWSQKPIEMFIAQKGAGQQLTGMGIYIGEDAVGVTPSPNVSVGNEIEDANGTFYEVKAVRTIPFTGKTKYQVCDLVKLPLHADRPKTSGTWHLDSASLKTDARYRQKLYLETYLVAADITKDDGVTQASYTLCFAKPNYQISQVFNIKDVDLVFSIGIPESEALPLGVGYLEKVPIELFAINKTDVTATNLIEKGYQELRRICETYPLSSLRTLDRLTDNEQNLGSTVLYSVSYIMRYKRYAT